ncbi:MAG: dipicolinate synthase subunit B [Eubacterium sp.]|nr:dipicolinate synthase subunit B [Eubacterium sp.]MDD7417936.1 dipicolinate synthase subunit B [Ruminococcus sp.]
MGKKKQRTVGFAITGSFCTYEKIKGVVRRLVEEDNRVVPIFSNMAQTVNCRFGNAKDFIIEIQEITGERGIFSIQEAEPIGPKGFLDVLVIAPCTGNTMAKLCAGITDSPVLMAAKAHMRNDRPVVISLSTNDALGASLKNIGMLMNTKNIYFVPFGQDDYRKKPKSMIAHTDLIEDTIEAALEGKQLQPVVRSPF